MTSAGKCSVVNARQAAMIRFVTLWTCCGLGGGGVHVPLVFCPLEYKFDLGTVLTPTWQTTFKVVEASVGPWPVVPTRQSHPIVLYTAE